MNFHDKNIRNEKNTDIDIDFVTCAAVLCA